MEFHLCVSPPQTGGHFVDVGVLRGELSLNTQPLVNGDNVFVASPGNGHFIMLICYARIF